MTFRVGDKVIYKTKYSGVVVKTDGITPYPIQAEFCGLLEQFTEEGRLYQNDSVPSIVKVEDDDDDAS